MLSRAIVLFCCFALTSGAIARASKTELVPIRQAFAEFPRNLNGWKAGKELPFDQATLRVLGVDDYVSRTYVAPDGRAGAGLYVGYYQSQRQGDAIHSPMNCIPGAGWEPVARSSLRIAVPAGAEGDSEIDVNRYVIQKGLDRQLVLYWYQSHGRVVANEYWSKLYLIGDAVRLNRTDAALVRVIIPAPEGEGEARAERQAIEFVRALFPTLTAFLPS